MTTRMLQTTSWLAIVLATLLASAGCRQESAPAEQPAAEQLVAGQPAAEPAAEIVVMNSRIVEDVDLCDVVTIEELEWRLGRRLTSRPESTATGCTATAGDLAVIFAGRTSASGSRVMVGGNTAFADAGPASCTVSVALLAGSTEQVGSYLAVTISANGEPNRVCRMAATVAEYLLAVLPRH